MAWNNYAKPSQKKNSQKIAIGTATFDLEAGERLQIG